MCRQRNLYTCYVKLKYFHYMLFTGIDFIHLLFFYVYLFYLFAGLHLEGSKAKDKLTKLVSSVK